MFAASQGRADIVQLLVDGQADVNARCETVKRLKLVLSCLYSVCVVVLDRVRLLLVSAWCPLLVVKKKACLPNSMPHCKCCPGGKYRWHTPHRVALGSATTPVFAALGQYSTYACSMGWQVGRCALPCVCWS